MAYTLNDYKDLLDRAVVEAGDPDLLKTQIIAAKEEIITTLVGQLNQTYGFVTTDDNTVFFFNKNKDQLDYYDRCTYDGLTTIDGGSVDLLSNISTYSDVAITPEDSGRGIKNPQLLNEIDPFDNTITSTPGEVELRGSQFEVFGPDFTTDHVRTDWVIFCEDDMINPYRLSVNDEINLTTFRFTAIKNKKYYIKFRYKSCYHVSNWSKDYTMLIKKDSLINKPNILSVVDNYITATDFSPKESSSIFSHANWLISEVETFEKHSTRSMEKVSDYSHLLAIIEPDTDYYVKVAYIDKNGNTSPYSDYVKINMDTSIYVDPPTILTPIQDAADVDTMVVTVSPPVVKAPYTNSLVTVELRYGENLVNGEIVDYKSTQDIDLTTHLAALEDIEQYHIQARYVLDNEIRSGWSDVRSFTTSILPAKLDPEFTIYGYKEEITDKPVVVFDVLDDAVGDDVFLEYILLDKDGYFVNKGSKNIPFNQVSASNQFLQLTKTDGNALEQEQGYYLSVRYRIDDVTVPWHERIFTVNKSTAFSPIKPRPQSPTLIDSLVSRSSYVAYTIGGSNTTYLTATDYGIWGYNTTTNRWDFILNLETLVDTNYRVTQDIINNIIYLIHPSDPDLNVMVDVKNKTSSTYSIELRDVDTVPFFVNNFKYLKADDLDFIFGGYKNTTHINGIWRNVNEHWFMITINAPVNLDTSEIVLLNGDIHIFNFDDGYKHYLFNPTGYNHNTQFITVNDTQEISTVGKFIVDNNILYNIIPDGSNTVLQMYYKEKRSWKVIYLINDLLLPDTLYNIINGKLYILTSTVDNAGSVLEL